MTFRKLIAYTIALLGFSLTAWYFAAWDSRENIFANLFFNLVLGRGFLLFGFPLGVIVARKLLATRPHSPMTSSSITRNTTLLTTIGYLIAILAGLTIGRPLYREYNHFQDEQSANTYACVEEQIAKEFQSPQMVTSVSGRNLHLSNGWTVEPQIMWPMKPEFIEKGIHLLKGKSLSLKLVPNHWIHYRDNAYTRTNPKICNIDTGGPIPIETASGEFAEVYDHFSKNSLGPQTHRLDCMGIDREFCDIAAKNQFKLDKTGGFTFGHRYSGGGGVFPDLEMLWNETVRLLHVSCSEDRLESKVRIGAAMLYVHNGLAWVDWRIEDIDPQCGNAK